MRLLRGALLVTALAGGFALDAAAQGMGPITSSPPWAAKQRPKPGQSDQQAGDDTSSPALQRPLEAQPGEPPKDSAKPKN